MQDDDVLRLMKSLRALQHQYERMVEAIEPFQKMARLIEGSPALLAFAQDLREKYSSEYIPQGVNTNECIQNMRDILERFDLEECVDKAIVSGDVIETMARHSAIVDGKEWATLSENDRNRMREKCKLEHMTHAYALWLLTPLEEIGILVVEYVENPGAYFLHDVLHEALHLRGFKEYPNLNNLNNEAFEEALRQVGENLSYVILFGLRQTTNLLIDLFVEKEMMNLDSNIVVSKLIGDLQGWLENKSHFEEMRSKDKKRAVLALAYGIFPIYLRYLYLRSEIHPEPKEITEILSLFPQDIQEKMIEIGDFVNDFAPASLSVQNVMETWRKYSELLLAYAMSLGIEF